MLARHAGPEIDHVAFPHPDSQKQKETERESAGKLPSGPGAPWPHKPTDDSCCQPPPFLTLPPLNPLRQRL